MSSDFTVVIAAAGIGSRLGMNLPKSLVEINGRTVLERLLTECLHDVADVRLVVGFRADEVVGRPLFELLTEEACDLVRELFNPGALDDPSAGPTEFRKFEMQQRCKDGSLIWGEVMVKSDRNNQGEIVGHHGITRNVTERKRLEGELLEREKQFRGFVENANDIIYTVDLQGYGTYLSPNYQKILGVDPAEIVGKHVAEVVPASVAVDAFELLAGSSEITLTVGLHARSQARMLTLVGTLPQRARCRGRCLCSCRRARLRPALLPAPPPVLRRRPGLPHRYQLRGLIMRALPCGGYLWGKWVRHNWPSALRASPHSHIGDTLHYCD